MMNRSAIIFRNSKRGIQWLCVISFSTLFLFVPLVAPAQTHFSDVIGHPVLGYGEPGEWDDAVVWNPAVVKDGDTLRMWFTGHNESIWTESTTGNIGYAWSVDGYTWHKFPENPVLRAELEWEGGKLYGSAVIKDGDTLKMWYGAEWTRSSTGYVISPAKSIGYTQSVDGKTWIRHPEPVLEHGSESAWDSDFIVPHTVIKEKNEFKMWYWAGKPGFPFEESLPQIGLATSSDGIHWAKYDDPLTTESLYAYSDPVLPVGSSSAWDAHRVIDPIVLPTDSGYEMWYSGGNFDTDIPQEIGYATSEDGIHWTRDPENPVIPDYSFSWGNTIYGGSMLKYEDNYHFWFSCFHTPPTQARPQIGYAKSYTPISIPDNAFLNALIAEGIDTDNNKIISTIEAESAIILNISSYGISDLTGIEAFVNLDTLICNNNELLSLNTSGITSLKYLECRNNDELGSLDVTMNTALTFLDCSYTLLTSLDVSNNIRLTDLICCSNSRDRLSNLDISNCNALKRVECPSHNLTSLDVTDKTALEELDCRDNQLTSLDVSNNLTLTKLDCSQNQLTDLDVSENIVLEELRCSCNQLTQLDVSKNSALTVLRCGANEIYNLDISNNTGLERLYCINMELTHLDVSNNIALKTLNCTRNRISSLDVSNNIALEELNCERNQLDNLDISNNAALKELWCEGNELSSLDISNNSRLERLNCGWNRLTQLEVTNRTTLWELNCSNNQLSGLNVSHNPVLGSLDCRDNQLTNLDVSGAVELRLLDCENNQLTELHLSGDTSLHHLNCSGNQLTTLDLSNIVIRYQYLEPGFVAIKNMPTLHDVCVWTMPFPPDGVYDGVYVDTTGSPNVTFSLCIPVLSVSDSIYQPDSVMVSSTRDCRIYLVDENTDNDNIYRNALDSIDVTAYDTVGISIPNWRNGVYWLYGIDSSVGNISEKVSFEVFGVGLNPHNAEQVFLYPNPVRNHLFINSGNLISGNLQITSLNGQVLINQKLEGTSHQIDLSFMKPGVYLLTIQSHHMVTTRKIIKL